jgi:hypothetical protein
MEIKVTKNGDVTLLEIQKAGNPVNAQNPVDLSELAPLEIPEGLGGKIVIVSGMPVWALSKVILAVKNLYSVVATVDVRFGGGIVVHSLDAGFPVGTIIPLA